MSSNASATGRGSAIVKASSIFTVLPITHLHVPTCIDRDVVARDVLGAVGDQEIDRARDIVLFDEAAERRLGGKVVVDLLFRLPQLHCLGGDDRVHAPTVGDV